MGGDPALTLRTFKPEVLPAGWNAAFAPPLIPVLSELWFVVVSVP